MTEDKLVVQQKPNESLWQRFRFPFLSDTLFSFLCFVIFVLPLATSPFMHENYETPKYAIFLLGAGVALSIFLVTKRYQLRFQRTFFVLLGLFLLWSVLTLINSQDILNTIFSYDGRLTNSILFHFAWSIYLVLLLSVLDREKLTWVVRILFFDAVIIALWALFQSAGVGFYDPSSRDVLPRVPSLLGNPNFSSMFMTSVAAFGFFLLHYAKTFWHKLYYGFGLFIIIWSVVLLSSRASLIGFAASLSLVAIGLLWHKVDRKVLLSLGLALIILGALSATFYSISRPKSVAQTFELTDQSLVNRFLAWDKSATIIKAHPWLGVGLGNFHIAFAPFRDSSLVSGGNFDDAHNVFLQLAVTGGIPLALIFALMLGFVGLRALKRLIREPDWITLSALAGLCSFILNASFGPVVVPCWFILAILFAILLHPDAKTFSGFQKFIVPRQIGWLLALLLIVWPVGYLSSEYFLYFGVQAYNAKQFQRSSQLFSVAKTFNPSSRLVLDYVAASSIGEKKDTAITERAIEKMIKIHPTTVASYYNASRTYAYLFSNTRDPQFLEKYLENAQKGLLMAPYARERYYPVAYWYYVTGDLENARRMINRTVTLHDKDLPGWLLLASIYQQQGKKDQTVFVISKLRQQFPSDPMLKKLLVDAKAIPDIKQLVIPAQFGYGGSYIE